MRNRPLNLLIISNPQSPGTDYYRTVGPFTQLAKDYPADVQIRIESPESVLWFHIFMCDAVLFQRPNGAQILDYMKEAKRMGKIIIADIDDLLHEIPGSNPSKKHFGQKKTQDTIEAGLKITDHLFVSTPPLKEYYAKYIDPERITIVRNGWNTEEHPAAPISQQRKPVRMIWRGSVTHMADLHTVKEAVKGMAKDPAFAFVMVGLEEWLGFDLPDTIQYIGWQTLFSYFELMYKSEPDYGIFPLTDDDFNRCKSNIFALECLRAGVLPIVPMGFPEWDIPGILRYRNSNDLKTLFAQIKSGKVDKVGLVEKAREFVLEHLTVQKQNLKRLEVIRSL